MVFADTGRKEGAIYMTIGFALFKGGLGACKVVGTVLQHGRKQSETVISY